MADLASSCKEKLAYFRIKELKDILNQLGLAKQGKKQELVDRVLALLSNEQGQRHHGWGRKNALTSEQVAKVIDDTYRKMQVQCAPDLATRSHSGSDFCHLRPKEEASDLYHVETKVRCLCGSTLLNDNVIKCEDDKCQVWQHMSCVLIPDKPTEGVGADAPPQFYCELCRLSRADPFWVTTGHPLPPVKFMSSGVGNDGASVTQCVEKSFQLSRADRETVQRPEYDLQVWCILLNDKVQFRMQWPQYAELQVNGYPVRVVTRPGSQLLGINGRDDGPLITTCSREGINKISLSRVDTRTFCFGVRIVRRRTVSQVLNLIPKEGEGESFEDALTRVRRCLGGGGAADNADSDSDLEVVTESVTVNLRCPNSGSRMRIAGRFKPCVHMGCFDLETFVELNQRSRKWQCPICLKNYAIEHLMIDPYFNRITSLLRNCSEDVNELDVKPDGSWRVKGDAANQELSQWHMPDGMLCDSKEDTKAEMEIVNDFKREGTSDGHKSLKLGIRKNPNGIWEVRGKADDKKPSIVGNHIQTNNMFRATNIVPSSSGSYRDGEDASVNQEGCMQFDLSLNQEFDSFPGNFVQTYNMEDRPQQQQNAADVIVLSDSDEENDTMVRQPVAYDNAAANGNNSVFTTGVAGYPERYQEDAGVGTSGLGLLSTNAADFEINNWPLHSYAPKEQGFQFFEADTDVANPFVGSNNSFTIAPEDYSLDCNVGIEGPSVAHNLSIRQNNDIHGTLVDNPLALAGDDPSLQIFLPSHSTAAPLQEEMNEHANVPNGVQADDWISLTLAAGGCGNEQSTSVAGLKSQPKNSFDESGAEPLTDAVTFLVATAAAALPSKNNDISSGADLNPRSIENIFSHPRQPRSVRPRLCLSIDTDSE